MVGENVLSEFGRTSTIWFCFRFQNCPQNTRVQILLPNLLSVSSSLPLSLLFTCVWCVCTCVLCVCVCVCVCCKVLCTTISCGRLSSVQISLSSLFRINLACLTLQQQTFLRKTAELFLEKVSLLGQVKHRQKWKIIFVTPVLVSQQWLVTLRTRWLPTSGQCCLWDDWWPPLVSWGRDSSSSSLVLSTTCPWLSCEFSCPFLVLYSSPLAVLWVFMSFF